MVCGAVGGVSMYCTNKDISRATDHEGIRDCSSRRLLVVWFPWGGGGGEGVQEKIDL
jgi:hypothetical protein